MMMRWLTLAVTGLTAFGMVACEVQDGEGDTTQTDTSTGNDTMEQDTSTETAYYAVFLEDLWDGRCLTSSVGAHGADIDAIGLYDENGDVLWVDAADNEFDSNVCPKYGYSNVNAVKGAPDGELVPDQNTTFYSLAGGWLIAEFTGQAQIIPGYELSIYEIDDAYCPDTGSCVGSEPYEIYLATDLDCVNTGANFRNECMVFLSDEAEGSVTVKLTSF